MAKRLAVAIAYAGLETGTYIRAHVNALTRDGRGITLVFNENPTPAWWPASETITMYPRRPAARLSRNLIGIASHRALEALDYARLGWCLLRHEVDVLFVEYVHLALAMLPVAGPLGVKVIAHAHGYDVSAQPAMPGWKEIYSQQLPKLRAIVAVSNAMREQLIHLGADPQAVAVVPCGVAVATELKTGLRQRGGRRLLSVGRLVEKKGPMFLLEVFRRVQGRVPDVELHIVGDGPFLAPMRQLVQASGLQNVSFHGVLGHVDTLRLIEASTILLQPSVTAGNGDMGGDACGDSRSDGTPG